MSAWDEVMSTYGEDIENASSEYIKASNILPYSISEIKAVFSEDELSEIASFLKEMKAATADNERKLQLITQYKQVAFGLLKLAKIVV
ncbi:hypothetical protein [Pseudoalteromonas sp. OANN1]|uniref:hypothetical protein n=1 Tax=Pseudoalteromonas sp. OANN1 TaxID=2954497 RepID=UPI002097FB23|nr:hypothetical protein [Pseudoalteromonas sp. OANN1]MCO7199438.1 hypothetical protein [Pseudoalteromonas sp. OANN1]